MENSRSLRIVFLVCHLLRWLDLSAAGVTVPDTIDLDFEAIEEAVLTLNRPDFMEIPHLLQNVNVAAGYSTYKWAEDVEGIPENEKDQVALKRSSMDHHVKTIIFPSGQFSFGQMLNRSYVVLRRHSTEKEIFFFNLAYLRDENSHIVVEWTTYNPKLYHKPRIERELCQADACDFPEWILGTCPFVSHVCTSSFQEDPPRNSSESTTMANSTTTNTNSFTIMADASAKKREISDANLIKDKLSGNTRRKRSTLRNHVKRRHVVSEDEETKKEKAYSKLISQLILHSVNCIDCQTIGPYFGDLEEDPELSQKLGLHFRREFGLEARTTRLSYEGDIKKFNVPYIGYGSCKHSEMIIILQKPKSEEIDDIIQYYLSTLRVDCRHSLVSEIRGWLTTKLRFLHIQPDLSLKVLPTSPLLKYASLTCEEFEMMVSALFFYKYTVVYLQEKTLGHIGTRKFNPTNLTLSRRMLFLTRLFLEVIETIREHFPHHIIKLTRTLARMLKNKFYSLLQEKLALNYQTLKAKETTGLGREVKAQLLDKLGKRNTVNYNDRLQIMGLKEFVLYGMGPTMKSSTPTDTAFNSFYSLNSKRIKLLVDIYGFDFENYNVMDLDQPFH